MAPPGSTSMATSSTRTARFATTTRTTSSTSSAPDIYGGANGSLRTCVPFRRALRRRRAHDDRASRRSLRDRIHPPRRSLLLSRRGAQQRRLRVASPRAAALVVRAASVLGGLAPRRRTAHLEAAGWIQLGARHHHAA